MNTISVEEMKNDYNWRSAFNEAMNGQYLSYGEIGPISNVIDVIACDEGENDGAIWIAVVQWSGSEGAFCVMRAGCDYTGWDCQASGKMEFYSSLEEAIHPNTLTEEERCRMGI